MTEKNNRPIRSFVKRQGRMTPGQNKAYELFWQQYGIKLENKAIDSETLFQRQAPTIVEIGIGMGEALLEVARKNPQNNYIGIDVHKPGIGAVLMGIAKDNLTNIRLFNDDAIEVLNTAIKNDSLAAVHLFFPDPWPKKRHHKRRIVNDLFVQLIRSKLKVDGYLHMATDWENYAESMMEVMNNAIGFINVKGKGQFIERPESRPKTRFEKRGERLGHGIWDLLFIRQS